MIFYLPFDLGYKIFRFLPVKIVCAALKEVYRYVHVLLNIIWKQVPIVQVYSLTKAKLKNK